jgi:polyhydroxyalkanoate synthesis repressor PhaR
MAAMVIIKRYGNRRLYDTDDSRYITLGEIATKVRAGDDVRVVEASSGDDLTPQILSQIIFEDRDAARLLPIPLLHQLIRLGDDALAEFFGRYVTWALEVYLQTRQGVGAIAQNPFMTPFAHAAFSPFQAFTGGTGADDLAALRREVEELKKKVNKPPRK